MPITPEDPPAAIVKEPPESRVVTEARVELERVQSAILEKNRHLLSCNEVELPKIARELQRLRVANIILNELVTNIADPTAKQEIGLLAKMLNGRQESGEGTTDDEALEAAAAADRLRGLNIDPDSADNLARGLRALQAVMRGGTLARPS
jgi:hypothetical protein